MGKGNNDDIQFSVTDLKAIEDNTERSVSSFAQRYIPMPRFDENCEIFDQAQLRDAMGLRATFESGDPWPAAEKLLLEIGFRWHTLGGMRVMYLRENPNYKPDDGFNDGEEIKD